MLRNNGSYLTDLLSNLGLQLAIGFTLTGWTQLNGWHWAAHGSTTANTAPLRAPKVSWGFCHPQNSTTIPARTYFWPKPAEHDVTFTSFLACRYVSTYLPKSCWSGCMTFTNERVRRVCHLSLCLDPESGTAQMDDSSCRSGHGFTEVGLSLSPCFDMAIVHFGLVDKLFYPCLWTFTWQLPVYIAVLLMNSFELYRPWCSSVAPTTAI